MTICVEKILYMMKYYDWSTCFLTIHFLKNLIDFNTKSVSSHQTANLFGINFCPDFDCFIAKNLIFVCKKSYISL